MSKKPLPVIDILNNVINLNNYLTALDKITLPDQLTNDPQYSELVENFNQWRYFLWETYYDGLVNSEIVAQPREVQNIFDAGLDDISIFHDFFYGETDSPTPLAVESADEVANTLTKGNGYISQLAAIAKKDLNADKAKVKLYLDQADKLQKQFENQETELTDKALSTGKDLVCAAIDVTVAIASEGDEVKPLVKGITTLGKDGWTELQLTSDINDTLSELETSWKNLDDASIELAKMTTLIEQLKKVTEQEETVYKSLSGFVNEWSEVAEVTKNKKHWKSSGIDRLKEWSQRMNCVSFETRSQTVSTS